MAGPHPPPDLTLSRAELEGLGFCYNSSLPFEQCQAEGICRCSLEPGQAESFRQEVTDDLAEINRARRDG